MTHDCALLWFRRDLRLTDNPALQAALSAARSVVPVYVHDPDAEAPWAPGGASRAWLHRSLAQLAADLAGRGSTLVLRSGPADDVLRALLRETGATAVFWNRLYEPAAVARDTTLKAALRADGIEVQSSNAALWREPWQLRTGAGGPYRVFTPFWRTLSADLPDTTVQPAPARIPAPHKVVAGQPLEALGLAPQLGWDRGFYDRSGPGEAGALDRLRDFIDDGLAGYHAGRDLPAGDSVSALSPHLHFGEIGPRQALAAVRAAQAAGAVPERDAEHFLRELGWREFAHHLLHHFPATVDAPLDHRFDGFRWRAADDCAADLRAWQRGRTGIPIVDAGMRELWTTGRMHNRVRMIVASLLTKNLRVPWQQGARWFWDTLVDADLANNTLGWQWVAGCGADAAPYFRVFNPVLQSKKFDPDGVYIRRWLPELSRLPAAALHAPWEAQPAVLRAAGVALGHDYPQPIVDLASSRRAALDAYAAMRQA